MSAQDPHLAPAAPWIALAALSGALSVAFGAFGAHGLEARQPDLAALAAYRTGAQYHLAHSLALLGAGLMIARGLPMARAASVLFALGILLFSGSLYVLGITGSRALVMATPIGGLTFIAGWLALAVGGLRAGARRS